MSVSSHLTPEPERRLWLILESMQAETRAGESKLFLLTALAAGELLAATWLPDAPAGWRLAPLAAALPLGVLGLLPLDRARPLPLVDGSGKPSSGDWLVASDDLAKYSRSELILKLDRYLGGGITATQYYEDLVGRILAQARVASRKKRLLLALTWLLALGQLGLALVVF